MTMKLVKEIAKINEETDISGVDETMEDLSNIADIDYTSLSLNEMIETMSDEIQEIDYDEESKRAIEEQAELNEETLLNSINEDDEVVDNDEEARLSDWASSQHHIVNMIQEENNNVQRARA